MAKKVHTDTLLVFMVQGEVCLVLEKRIERKTIELDHRLENRWVLRHISNIDSQFWALMGGFQL